MSHGNLGRWPSTVMSRISNDHYASIQEDRMGQDEKSTLKKSFPHHVLVTGSKEIMPKARIKTGSMVE